MKNFRSTLVLFIIAALLIGYISLFDKKIKSTEERQRTENELFHVEASDINWLQIKSQSETVVLEKKDNQWKITSPIHVDADERTIDRYLVDLQYLEMRREIPPTELPKEDILKQWGFSNPSLEISFKTSKGKYDLIVGRKTAVSELVYARTSLGSNAPVYLISSSIADSLKKGLDDLRSRVVFHFNPFSVEKCGIRQMSGPSFSDYAVLKKGKQWEIQKPVLARADSTKLEQWFNDLLSLRVDKFVSDDGSNLNQYGLDSPRYQIWVGQSGKKDEDKLLVGNSLSSNSKQVYAKMAANNSVFTLETDMINRLVQNFLDIRDRHVLPAFSEEQVDKIGFQGKNLKLFYIKKGSDWQSEETEKGLANKTKIKDFIETLRNLESQEIKQEQMEIKVYGLDNPEEKIEIEFNPGLTMDKGQKVELYLGKVENGLIYAKNSIEPFVYTLKEEFTKSLPKTPWDWKDLSVMQLDPQEITQWDVSSSLQSFSVKRKEGKLIATGMADTDEEKLKDGLEYLSHLKAVRWIGPQGTELSKPQVKITVHAKKNYILLIGPSLPSGGRLALIEGNPLAFELEESIFRVLTSPQKNPSTLQEAKPQALR
ncbi:DUF4340 domain-containing protein [Candidatus Methylacidiphilum infernorum]|uniref:DUF4340 domain-containing protein n=1 Tax=Candidatus Methylacidiphilum infernorum TaxID=511746 RepID=A0ABX7PUM2_9BACT|nr:DUF4340 domain-containing protein [Candidatus Methylacidiphilum infernorum]QSR86304.1 DUF4340 domain-containing protein [Candidatus Methylacidiphilum infernorum]